MITPEQVWLAVEPVDMRMGIDGLSLRIQQLQGRVHPAYGTAYAFCNRQGNRVKLMAPASDCVSDACTGGGSPGLGRAVPLAR